MADTRRGARRSRGIKPFPRTIFWTHNSTETMAVQNDLYLNHEPLGRYGSCSFVYDGKFYLCHGSTSVKSIRDPQSALQEFDFHTGQWSPIRTTGSVDASDESEVREKHGHYSAISGASCTLISDRLYMFGGGPARSARVRELNMTTLSWRNLEAKNPEDRPLCKDKAGMVSYGDGELLCMFGGFGFPEEDQSLQAGGEYKGAQYVWHPEQPYCWTNELHLFHIAKGMWIIPETTGVRPPPCAAFTFTKVDPHRVVLFGGRQLKERVNEVHILDMDTWNWSGAICQTYPEELWPKNRSFHTACTLVDPNCVHVNKLEQARIPSDSEQPCITTSDEGSCQVRLEPKLFILWGMDNDHGPVDDAWIFHVDLHTWEKVPLPQVSLVNGRMWHTMAAHYPSECEAHVVAFGGSVDLYRKPLHSIDITTLADTTVFCFGVGSLYCQSLEYIALNYEDYAPLLSHLPIALQRAIAQCREKQCNLGRFAIVKL